MAIKTLPSQRIDQWAKWRGEWEANQQAQRENLQREVGKGWSFEVAETLERQEGQLLREIVLHLSLRPANPRDWDSYDRAQFRAIVAAAQIACPGTK